MRIFNRRARYDYQLLERLEAGIVLTGDEVKSIRAGHINLEEGFVRFRNGEAWLVNAHIAPYSHTFEKGADPRRDRKLLLHKRELLNWSLKAAQKNLTIIPILCYTKGRNIKLAIALAKGKRQYEKREAIKKKEQIRQIGDV